jgi:hypothetical protein
MRAQKSVGWLVGAGVVLVLLVAGVVGFVVLGHKASKTEQKVGTAPLRPIEQANRAQLDSDLHLAASAEEVYLAEHGQYTTDLASAGFQPNSAEMTVVSATTTNYCLKATSKTAPVTVEYDSRSGGLSATPCG